MYPLHALLTFRPSATKPRQKADFLPPSRRPSVPRPKLVAKPFLLAEPTSSLVSRLPLLARTSPPRSFTARRRRRLPPKLLLLLPLLLPQLPLLHPLLLLHLRRRTRMRMTGRRRTTRPRSRILSLVWTR